MSFDDITCSTHASTTQHSFCPISHYNYLDFYSWQSFDSVNAAERGLIAPSDANCAISSPNSLFSWLAQTPSLWPRIVLNETTAIENGIDKYFDLLGLAFKPMNITQRLTRVFVHAYGVDFNVSTSSSMPHKIIREYQFFTMYLRNGTQPQYYRDIVALWPNWGKGVNMVEMYGVDPQGETVPLCIDDLTIKFHEKGHYSEGNGQNRDGLNEQLTTDEWDDILLGDLGLVLGAKTSLKADRKLLDEE